MKESNRMNRIKFALVCIALLVMSLSANESKGFSHEEISSFGSGASFVIKGGHVEIKHSLIGDAKGRYELRSYAIEPLESNQYKVEILFNKRKGSLGYSHQETLYVMDDGVKFWIKKGDRIYRYIWNEASKNIEKSPNQTIIKELPKSLDVSFENINLSFIRE